MKNNIEDMLKLISDMEAIPQDDELSCLIKNELDDELSEDELETVFAAAGATNTKIRDFKEVLKSRGID